MKALQSILALVLSVFLLPTPCTMSEEIPLALLVHTQLLGQGADGSVMGVLIEVAPEDRERLGERVRVTTTLIQGEDLVDRQIAVAEVEDDGTVMLYREWPSGSYELRVAVASVEGKHSGIWIGDIDVGESEQRFTAPEDAPADAVALELTPPREDAVSFLPPPEIGGIGALQLEVEAPADTASVEFFRDGESLGRKNRAPWTVSVPLGDIVRRSMVRAVAKDARGNYLGEDALVLNSPSGQLGVEVLLAPEDTVRDGKRTITVAVNSDQEIQQVTLHLDQTMIARWAECPCVVEVPVSELEAAVILSVEAVDAKGTRGDAVITLEGGSGFVGTVQVELVELPVTVLDASDTPVTGLGVADFTVNEDGRQVTIEGFGTTADMPLSMVLAVDTSGSMTEIFPKVLRAVSGFAEGLLRPGDQAALIRFSWDAEVLLPLSEETDLIASSLERVVPEGGTSLHDAVVRSLEQFRGMRGRQALVLLTDGEDTTSRTGWQTARRFAHTMRVPIFPIGLGVGLLDFDGRSTLKDLAEDTGGEAFFPKNVEDLPEVYARISELLRSQYLLWYSSNSEKPLSEFREVEVEVAKDDTRVRTISGYYPGK